MELIGPQDNASGIVLPSPRAAVKVEAKASPAPVLSIAGAVSG